MNTLRTWLDRALTSLAFSLLVLAVKVRGTRRNLALEAAQAVERA